MDLNLIQEQIRVLLQDKEQNAIEAFAKLYEVQQLALDEGSIQFFMEFMDFDPSLNIPSWYRAMNQLLDFFTPEEFKVFGYYRLMELLTLENSVAISFCQTQLRKLQALGEQITNKGFEMLLASARKMKPESDVSENLNTMDQETLAPVTMASLNRGRGRPSLRELDSIRDENLRLLAMVEVYGRRNIQLRERILNIKEALLEVH